MDLARYLGLFVSDARDHLAGLDGDLVRLETADGAERPQLVDRIFRHLHSLKGGAATMGFTPIAELAHAAEELVDEVREARRVPTADEVDLLLETADALRQGVSDVAEGRDAAARPELARRLVRRAKPNDRDKNVAPTPAATEPIDWPSEPHASFVVRISPKSSAPAARAFLALRRLESVATVLQTEPPLQEVKAGKLPDQRLVVHLRGAPELEALRTAIARIPDVDGLDALARPPFSPARAPEPPSLATSSGDPTVRVKVELLDQLLELAGELVLQTSRLREKVRAEQEPSRQALGADVDRLRVVVKELNGRVLAARQTPVRHVADRLPRAVRDLSRQLDKPLELVVDGADVSLDRGLADALVEPVLHAIRNAADHGIEPAAERERSGKPRLGRLTFAARREKDRVLVDIADDGRGFDVEKLKARAVERGKLLASDAAAMSEAQALRLAFLPGLSTKDDATDISGRGVGMDAVLRAVEELGGQVSLESVAGQGSTVRLSLPATVSVTNLLLVGLGDEVFGLPLGRVVYATEADLSAKSVMLHGENLPGYPLGRLLGLPETTTGLRPVLVVEGEGRRLAVGVDRLLGQEEVVLRPVGPPLERVAALAGTAILGSGRPIFVLDVPRLVT